MIALLTHRRPEDDPDTRLMLRVREGDRDAFDELVLRHRRRVIGTVSTLMGSRSTVEDLAQQVFLLAYRARKSYEPSAKFSTWLFAITKNVVFNAKRGLKRRRQHLIESSGELPKILEFRNQVSADSNPFDSLLLNEMRHEVQDALGRLLRQQRRAIELVYFQGHCYRSAAAEMSLSENAVRQHLHRGKAKLRKLLKPRMAS